MNGFDEAWFAEYQTRRARASGVSGAAAIAETALPTGAISIRLELPLPPSVNALYANVAGKGRVKTKAYREWIRAAVVQATMQPWGGDRIEGSFGAEIDIFQRTAADIDNRIKAALDICKRIGAIRDDRYLVSLAVELYRGEPKILLRLNERRTA